MYNSWRSHPNLSDEGYTPGAESVTEQELDHNLALNTNEKMIQCATNFIRPDQANIVRDEQGETEQVTDAASLRNTAQNSELKRSPSCNSQIRIRQIENIRERGFIDVERIADSMELHTKAIQERNALISHSEDVWETNDDTAK